MRDAVAPWRSPSPPPSRARRSRSGTDRECARSSAGKAAGFELRAQQFLAHAMNADAAERARSPWSARRRHRTRRRGAPRAAPRRCPCRSTRRSALSARVIGLRAAALAPGFCAARSAVGRSALRLEPPSRRNTASAARAPDSQAPPTVPHSVSCTASPAKNTRLRIGSIRMRRAPCPPGDAAENAPSVHGLLVPLRRLRAPHRLLDVGAEQAGEPFHARTRPSPCRPAPARSRPKLPPTSTIDSGVPPTLASSAAVRGPADFSNTRSSRCRPSGLPGSSSAM